MEIYYSHSQQRPVIPGFSDMKFNLYLGDNKQT